MKWVFCLLILAGIALCAGCTTVNTTPATPLAITPTPQSVSVNTAVVPNLLGTWSGTAKGYTEGIGFRDNQSMHATLVVTQQKDRVFTGNLSIPYRNGTVRIEGFAGIISQDGKKFTVVEFDPHEYDDGVILSENEIEMVFIFAEEPQSIMLDSFTRTR